MATEPGQVRHVLPQPGVAHTVLLQQLRPAHLLPVQEADVELHGDDALHPVVGDVVAHLVCQGATGGAGGRELLDRLAVAVPAEEGGDGQQSLTLPTTRVSVELGRGDDGEQLGEGVGIEEVV